MDIISPVGPRNPNSHISDKNKTAPVEEKKMEYEEGSQEIPLPSKGVFYMPPNFCKESIWVRPMDFRDEDILTTQKYIEEGTVFDKIVTAVIQEPNITANKLVPIDRDTILIWLRSNALGKDMTIEYKCTNPTCSNQKNIATWDLSEIEIPEYDPEVLKQLKENGEYKIITPQKEAVVYIKIPLIEESNDTQKKYLRKKEAEKLDYDSFATAALSLMVSGVEVNGKIIRNKKEILSYFEKIKLPLADSRWIKSEAKKISLKYDTKKDLVCKNCGNVQEGVELPIVHQNFLWTDGSTPLATA